MIKGRSQNLLGILRKFHVKDYHLIVISLYILRKNKFFWGTIESNRMLALAIIDEMIKLGAATPMYAWDDMVISKVTERVKSNIDEAAIPMALKSLSRVLNWAGKHEEALAFIIIWAWCSRTLVIWSGLLKQTPITLVPCRSWSA